MITTRLPRTNLGEIIADKLHQDILEGKLRPGDRLPPHEVLCERWGVSRVTLREALKKLDTKGLIEIHQGRGTFVRDNDRMILERQFEFHTVLGEKTMMALLEARKTVETALARLATERVTHEELATLSRTIGEMQEAVREDDSLKFARFDLEFHSEIGRIAKNEVLLMMLDKIHGLIETQQREMFEYDRYSKPLKAAFGDHRDIFEMIRSGNASGASEKMYQHIQRMENRVKSFYASTRDTGR